jgi:SAM-dependent methyltransferase
MEGYDSTTYGERWADVYDEWYDEPDDIDDTVAFLTDLAGPPAGAGCLLELGVGTGRLALPLAARGYDVRGVDSSTAMVDRLRAKPGGATLPVAIGDMAGVPVPPPAAPDPPAGAARAAGVAGTGDPGTPAEGCCAGVFVACNTFFGLGRDEAQRRCLRRIHDVLAPGGWAVIAGFVPAEHARQGRSRTVGLRSLTADRVVLTADEVDADRQTLSGQFIDITEQGIRLRPVHLRYLWPDQLDEQAAGAGLVLAGRWATWRREPFDDGSDAHVTLYRRPADRPPTGA